MTKALSSITDRAELLGAITALSGLHEQVGASLREQAIRAVHELGATRAATATAAGISRPTLNAWLDQGN